MSAEHDIKKICGESRAVGAFELAAMFDDPDVAILIIANHVRAFPAAYEEFEWNVLVNAFRRAGFGKASKAPARELEVLEVELEARDSPLRGSLPGVSMNVSDSTMDWGNIADELGPTYWEWYFDLFSELNKKAGRRPIRRRS